MTASLPRTHLGREQHARLGHVATLEHRADSLEHGVDGDVGEKAEPSLIHPDQRNIVWGQGARDVEHRAVAADDDGQIGHFADLLQRHHLEVVTGDMRGRQRIDHDPHARGCRKRRKL